MEPWWCIVWGVRHKWARPLKAPLLMRDYYLPFIITSERSRHRKLVMSSPKAAHQRVPLAKGGATTPFQATKCRQPEKDLVLRQARHSKGERNAFR